METSSKLGHITAERGKNMYLYSNPEREEDGHALPDVEVFYYEGDDEMPQGWYWQPCFPGCLPDGDMIGPFDSESAAIENMKEEMEE